MIMMFPFSESRLINLTIKGFDDIIAGIRSKRRDLKVNADFRFLGPVLNELRVLDVISEDTGSCY